jgi:hypothetical protein
MPRENEQEVLSWALKGNASAIDFCNQIFRISQTWDDLVDGDKPVGKGDINGMMWMALVEIPQNEFYLKNMGRLTTLLGHFATCWMVSNALEEEGTDHSRSISFVLRDAVSLLVLECAYLIGGAEWKATVSTHVVHHIFEDTLDEYKQSHALGGES